MDEPQHPKPPKHLPAKARDFWRTYYPLLADKLKPTDLANFELLALNWSIIQSADVTDGKQAMLFMASQKVFFALSKQFGLTPDARRKIDPPKQDTLSDTLARITGFNPNATPTDRTIKPAGRMESR